MGWLGWSEPIAMAADVNSISLALEGRGSLLKSIFGSGEDKSAPRRRMTQDRWRSIVRRTNAKFGRGGRQREG